MGLGWEEVIHLTLPEFVRRIARAPLLFQPGTAWRYSYSTDVLGRCMELLSGQPLEVFLQERLFRPLQMVDTGFWVPPEKVHRLARLYTVRSTASTVSEEEAAATSAAVAAGDDAATERRSDGDGDGVTASSASSSDGDVTSTPRSEQHPYDRHRPPHEQSARSSRDGGSGRRRRIPRQYRELSNAEAGDFTSPPTFVQAGGGLVSTATDYMRFAQVGVGGTPSRPASHTQPTYG